MTIEADKRRKLYTKSGIIASIALVVLISLLIVNSKVIQPNRTYNAAKVALDTGNNGETATLISKYALDCVQYNTKEESVTWETCSLRKWLNETFLNEAFTVVEQAQLAVVTVTADVKPKDSTSPV